MQFRIVSTRALNFFTPFHRYCVSFLSFYLNSLWCAWIHFSQCDDSLICGRWTFRIFDSVEGGVALETDSPNGVSCDCKFSLTVNCLKTNRIVERSPFLYYKLLMKHFDSYFVFFFAYHPLKFLRLQKGLKAISSPWRNGVVTNIFLIYRTINNVYSCYSKHRKIFACEKPRKRIYIKSCLDLTQGLLTLWLWMNLVSKTPWCMHIMGVSIYNKFSVGFIYLTFCVYGEFLWVIRLYNNSYKSISCSNTSLPFSIITLQTRTSNCSVD